MSEESCFVVLTIVIQSQAFLFDPQKELERLASEIRMMWNKKE